MGAPVYEFIGGKSRGRVRAYANGWFVDAVGPNEYAQQASKVTAQSYTALKLYPFAGEQVVTPERIDRGVSLSNGPISTVASLHLDISIPNSLMQEIFVNYLPRYNEVLTNPIVIEDGYCKLPEGPGWGTDIREDVLTKYPPVPYTPNTPIESEPYRKF